MSTTRLLANLVSSRALKSKLHDYYTLTKPEVNLLVLMTTWAGYYLGSRGPFRMIGRVCYVGHSPA
jgi:heme O synthase-like polyprenyltransferase